MLRSMILAATAAMLLAGCAARPTPASTAPSTSPIAQVQPAAPTPNLDNTVQARVAATVAALPKPTAPSAQPPTKPVAPQKDEPVTLDGKGIMKTPPFELRGGNYTISWTANDTPNGLGCYHGGAMKNVDSTSTSETVANASVPKGQSAAGTTQAYNLKAGRYYLDMSSGCTWSVTIAPQ